jgi:hypothetical protein
VLSLRSDRIEYGLFSNWGCIKTGFGLQLRLRRVVSEENLAMAAAE